MSEPLSNASNEEIGRKKYENFLKRIFDTDNKRKYTDQQLSDFSDEVLKITYETEQRKQFKDQLVEDNKTRPRTEKYIDQNGNEQEREFPKLSEEEIDAEVEKMMKSIKDNSSSDEPFSKKGSDDQPDQPTEEQGGGKALEGAKAAFPEAAQASPQDQIKKALEKQISETIPPIVPISTQQIGAMFMEPISRQAFCLIYFSPVGFFYIAIHTPCFYPIILPAIYPVIPMGPPPAGFIALAFSAYGQTESFIEGGSGLEYCGGSAPISDDFWKQIEVPKVDFQKNIPLTIQPCDPKSSFEALQKCAQSNDKISKSLMGDQPITPELANIMRLIQQFQQVTEIDPPIKADPTPQQVIDIFVSDGFDNDTFNLRIIQ